MSTSDKPTLHLLKGDTIDPAAIDRFLEKLTGEPTTPEEAAESAAMVEWLLAKRKDAEVQQWDGPPHC